jgi:hypothetical protein
MDPINEAHVSEPGLLVVDVAAADDDTALTFQQLLAERSTTTTPPELAPLTCGEIQRLFTAFVAPHSRGLAHRLSWSQWRRQTPSPRAHQPLPAPDRRTVVIKIYSWSTSTPAAVRGLRCVFGSGSGGRRPGGVFSRRTSSVRG